MPPPKRARSRQNRATDKPWMRVVLALLSAFILILGIFTPGMLVKMQSIVCLGQ